MGQAEKGMTEGETVGSHHRLDGQECEQALREDEGQGGLARCSPWVSELDTTERLNNNIVIPYNREFPGGLVFSIPGFHCCGLGSVPGWGTEIP